MLLPSELPMFAPISFAASISIEPGMKISRLSVAVVHLQFHRDDVPLMFQRGDADFQTLALQACRPHKGGVPWDTPARHPHRLQQPELYCLPVCDGLVTLHAGGDGVLSRRFHRADGGMKAVVPFA